MTFGAAAMRLMGVAAWVLGWRPDEFWRATPAELLAIWEARGSAADGDAPPDAATRARLQEMFPDG